MATALAYKSGLGYNALGPAKNEVLRGALQKKSGGYMKTRESLGMARNTLRGGVALLAVAAGLFGCVGERSRQVDLGDLPTPVLIRTLTWNVNGFRLADGRRDVAAFAKVIADAKVDFAALFGLDPKTAAGDLKSLGEATGLVVSVGNGVALVSRLKPEEIWPNKDHLVVEQPDFSITVVDFGGEPDFERTNRIRKTCGRGKLAYFCANPYFKKGNPAFDEYDLYYRTIADGIGVVRTWGAGGSTFAGEDRLGGAEFKTPAHLVIVKD